MNAFLLRANSRMNKLASTIVKAVLLATLVAGADQPSTAFPKPPQTAMMEIGNTSLTVVLGAKPSPAEKRVTELLAGRFKDRAGIDLAGEGSKAPLRLIIGTAASNEKIKAFAASHKEVAALGADGYVIAVEPGKPELYVVGQSDSGVVAGVGRLMREMRYEQGKVVVPSLQIAETPQMPNRGIPAREPMPPAFLTQGFLQGWA